MLVKIYPDNPNERELERVVNQLLEGELIVCPTDTVYAVACDALNVRAVESICRFKGIDPRKTNLSIVCCDLSQISRYAKVDTQVFKLMKRHLPGPFTFILNAGGELPKIFRNKKTVGIRVPDNAIVKELVRRLERPLMTTSVHDDEYEDEYTTDPELIHERMERVVSMVIVGGYGGLLPSTIVDCTGDEPVVTRQGAGEFIF
ncbi:MAG: L-threonylcarbamoyladenylate synthase [Bacteroidales bacterium]